MHYVILRDDDTNALTPVECLERLYRPFLRHHLPVNLAVIPRVRTDATRADGVPEGFVFARGAKPAPSVPIVNNGPLIQYLHNEPGFHIAQHGYHHSLYEFESESAVDVEHRLKHGEELLTAAGFRTPKTFVAPYDRFSRVSMKKVANRFRVLSTGWFEMRRLPVSWWPRYALNKMLKRPHWRVGHTLLLSHPGCLLSYNRPYDTILDLVKRSVKSRRLTVLVTHWWEYFREGKSDDAFINVLHQTAEWLGAERDIKMISFDDVANGAVRI
jgi:hypothetical protein